MLHYVFLAMKRIRKRIRRILKQMTYPFTTVMVIASGFLFRAASREQALRIACFIGDIAYGFLRIRRRLVEKNLRLTFPEKTLAEIRKIARQSYQNQVLNFIELLRIPLISSKEDARSLVEIRADRSFTERLSMKQGSVVVSGHLSSWEVIGVCTGMLLAPIHFVVKPLKNSFLDRYLNRLRVRNGNSVIYKDQSLRQGLHVIKNSGVLTVLGDQSNKEGDFYVEFLGRKSTIFMGPAFWALKAGVPLFVETSRRHESGRYVIEITEVDTKDLSYNKSDIRELTVRYTRALEEFIRKHPEEWLWLHDRWKRSPA